MSESPKTTPPCGSPHRAKGDSSISTVASEVAQSSTETYLETLPTTWNLTETLKYVRGVVHHVLNKELDDDERIFDADGLQSQQVVHIRNSFISAVRPHRERAIEFISQGFLYENPTITRLAKQLMAIVHSNPIASAEKLQEIDSMVSELSACFPKDRPSHAQKASSGEVVLLTGTTGGLGSQLLELLVTSPHISHVYALNRRSSNGKSLLCRQAEAIIERGLDISIVHSPKVTLVEGDATVEGLAIDPALYREIRDNVTLVIHNAWRVHHGLPLKAFKPNIRSVRTLIDVALESPRPNPPRFIFTSSVAVFKNWNSGNSLPLEGPMNDTWNAIGSGYAESKLVAERILENAARLTTLRPTIVRLGQLTGTSNGAWNCSDWVPTFVQSGQVIGALPAMNECIAWLSLETTAHVILEVRHSDSQYLHLAHPNPALWSDVFDVFSSRLGLPLISWDEWMTRVERNDAGKKILRLREHYGAWFHPMSPNNREAPGIPRMDLQQTIKLSPTLADPLLPQVGRNDAERWIRHWRMVGFLSNDEARL